MTFSTFVRKSTAALAVAAMLALVPGATQAASCGNSAAGFDAWLAGFKQKARASGITQATLDRALAGVQYDRSVISRDRSQKSFKLSFEEFYRRRAMVSQTRAKMNQHAGLLQRIEQRFGVPAEIVATIWGLETNFGKDGSGKYSIIQAIATLAYDCRRTEFFTGHLMGAMRIVQKGDMRPEEMRGGWAGEIGQVQFLPANYDKYAVDFDGDGRRDLARSVPDALASVANFLKGHGWQRGQPWGPGTANYNVIKDWNKAEVYARTIAVMAEKLK